MTTDTKVRVIGREGWWEFLRRPWHVRCTECRTIGRHQLLSAAQAQADAHREAHAIGDAMAAAFRDLIDNPEGDPR